MKKFTHFYSLTPEWQHHLAKEMNGELIDNKIIVIPKSLGQGHSYFTQITPGISVLLMDFVLNESVKINRIKSDNQLYILHFDLSENANVIKINNIDYKIGSYDNLGLAIIDNKIESSFKPAINKRTLALRLLVDKKLLDGFLKNHPSEEFSKRKIKVPKNSLYYYDNIDSNSILLIRSIKDKSVFDINFNSHLKGISLKLLGNFLNRYENSKAVENEVTELEIEAITKTKTYLLNNLYNPFPSISFLSEMAGMSPSKYKMLFKKSFSSTPNNFFIKEKMMLANKFLQSGDYTTLTEIIYELNYTKLSYFCSKYYDQFHRKPSDDFIKKI
ncbi:AraC family transcriptional regulator [Flavobacterium sp. KBS0721]|uniref:helix-turn-helix domain-containing protein n=1 Tax=Flavobacterium sp. KBS0721 TaxID=1179672 RepID=UPI0009900DE2|nr:AraC family transcriptional regulator [Flavobacterium sp. KBS0721]QDW22323.1 helix-turn-helix transcriptional regulator [Flavobacterium sp. KBS0721]